MAKGRKGLGSSEFTHVDDATAPIHTSHPDHFDALHYGEPVPKRNLEEIVLGPGAFGSPDPRTLGHIMHPQVLSPSAPELDPDFQEARGVHEVVVVTEESLNEMSKAELVTLARKAGYDVKSNQKKDEIISTILGESETVEVDEADLNLDEDEDTTSEEDENS